MRFRFDFEGTKVVSHDFAAGRYSGWRPRHAVAPHDRTVPKALVEVAGQPFFVHQLRLLARDGFERVVFFDRVSRRADRGL